MKVCTTTFVVITLCVLAGLIFAQKVTAQETYLPPDYYYPEAKAHYTDRVTQLAKDAPQRHGTIFVGDSITEGCNWGSLLRRDNVLNQGIGWDTSEGLMNRLPLTLKHKPDAIFLMMGINDLSYATSPEVISFRVTSIASTLAAANPSSLIVVQSVLPTHRGSRENILRLNSNIENSVSNLRLKQVKFVNLFPEFARPNGQLNPKLTKDGIHLNQAGCQTWAASLKRNKFI